MSLFPNYSDNKEIVGEFLIIENQLTPSRIFPFKYWGGSPKTYCSKIALFQVLKSPIIPGSLLLIVGHSDSTIWSRYRYYFEKLTLSKLTRGLHIFLGNSIFEVNVRAA